MLARLESAYSLIWGAHQIWGEGYGCFMIISWPISCFVYQRHHLHVSVKRRNFIFLFLQFQLLIIVFSQCYGIPQHCQEKWIDQIKFYTHNNNPVVFFRVISFVLAMKRYFCKNLILQYSSSQRISMTKIYTSLFRDQSYWTDWMGNMLRFYCRHCVRRGWISAQNFSQRLDNQ